MLLNQYKNDAILNVHPGFRTVALEEEILDVAEQHFGTPGERFFAYLHQHDPLRREVLRRRGYAELDGKLEHQWRRDLRLPIPDAPVPEGYTSLGLFCKECGLRRLKPSVNARTLFLRQFTRDSRALCAMLLANPLYPHPFLPQGEKGGH